MYGWSDLATLVRPTASLSSASAYDAGSLDDARMAGWMPAPGSADADILPDLDITRARARDLIRNSALGGSHIQTVRDNVIGHHLRFSSRPDYRLLGRDAEWAREWAANAESQFRTWANTTECDAARTQTLLGKARTAFGSFLANGDHLTLPVWMPELGGRWGTRLQGIESDRLSTPMQRMSSASLRGGVEIDGYGAPVAYHIRASHPGDGYVMGIPTNLQWHRVPAFTAWGRRRVIHVFDKDRDEQNRGITHFSRVLRESRILGEYVGHENHAALANAMIAGFIESDLPPEMVGDIFGRTPAAAEKYYKGVQDRYHRKKMEGGLFFNLPIGTKLSSFNTSRPNVAFEPFVRFMVRYLATGLNVPYELLLKDFSQTNYSSARAALLEAWRYFLSMRQLFADLYLQPVLLLWMEEAVDKGLIAAPDFYGNEYAYCRGRWIFAGRGWVDPVKESAAAQQRMDYHLSTLEDECAEQGKEWEEVLEQEAIERQYMRELDTRYGLEGIYSLAAPRNTHITINESQGSGKDGSGQEQNP